MKSKQLRKWALTAEIVSAIAVVVTIAFLAFQMRDNTNALRAQTYQDLSRDLNNWRTSVRDWDLMLSESKMKEKLAEGSPEEIGKIRLAIFEVWQIYEAAFFAKERGVLGDDEWLRFEYGICLERKGVAGQAFWASGHEGLSPFSEALTPAFVKYVDQLCD